MSAAQLNAEPLAPSQAAALLRQVTLSQAIRLAREGNYSAAEEILSALLGTGEPEAVTLDLLARIRAQQGAHLDAASLWRKVQQLDPRHLGAAAGLERLRAAQRRPVWLQPLSVLGAGLAAIVCIGFVLMWQARRQNASNAQLQQRLTELAKAESLTGRQQVQSVLAQVESISGGQAKAEKALTALGNFSGKLDSWAQAQEAQTQASSNQVEAFARELAAVKVGFEQRLSAVQADNTRLAAQHYTAVQGVSNQVAELRGAVDREKMLASEIKERQAAAEKLQADFRALEIHRDTLARQLGIPARPPDVAVMVPGVTTAVSGNAIVISFDTGLFDHGTHLKLGAKERLLAVGKILSQSGEPLRMHVVGFADDDRAFLKWSAPWEAALALERATVVAGELVQRGLVSPGNITVAGSTAEDRPGPSDSARHRLKNRTVKIHVLR